MWVEIMEKSRGNKRRERRTKAEEEALGSKRDRGLERGISVRREGKE